MSQNEQIIQRLKRGPITAADAIEFGCFRLAARVRELRNRGYNIQTELVISNGKRFARYYLRESSKAA